MKIPFLVQTAGSLIVSVLLIGMAYQSLSDNDQMHDKQIQVINNKQVAIIEDVTLIRISLSSIVTNQENQANQTERVIDLLERSLLRDRG